MADFIKPITEALVKGTPWAALIGIVGIIWQVCYVYFRDRTNDKQLKAEADLEKEKFRHQRRLEELRFEYERVRWREQLTTQLALKHVDARLKEYSELWSRIDSIANNKMRSGELNDFITKELAKNIRSWRYSAGGLLAEETTRESAYTLQQALWDFDGSRESFLRIRQARWLLREALRSDMGIGGTESGNSVVEAAERRQKLRSDLSKLQNRIGIQSEDTR